MDQKKFIEVMAQGLEKALELKRYRLGGDMFMIKADILKGNRLKDKEILNKAYRDAVELFTGEDFLYWEARKLKELLEAEEKNDETLRDL